MKRPMMSLIAAAAISLSASAVVAQVSINGSPVEKTPVALSFSNDKVIIHFGDNNTTEANLEDVTLSFVEGSTLVDELANSNLFRFNGVVGNHLSVSGLQANTQLAIYDLSGKVFFMAPAAEGEMEINIADLPAGAYLLHAGKDVVKFVKR